MTTILEGSPKFGGISGDYDRVMVFEDRVGIRAIDAMDAANELKRSDRESSYVVGAA